MTDRLKQIWGDFAGKTSARLTSHDIDSHARPPAAHRLDEQGERGFALKQGAADESDAVRAAFAALHADIQTKAKRGGRRRRGAEQQSFSLDDVTQVPSGLDEKLLADIKFTEDRVKRGPSDYLDFAAKRQTEWKRRKRKKFLGLF